MDQLRGRLSVPRVRSAVHAAQYCGHGARGTLYVDRLALPYESVAACCFRCSQRSDHHNLFLNCRGDTSVSSTPPSRFATSTMMMFGQYMERRGWKTPRAGVARGPECYWYFWCRGGLTEIGCDIDFITDHWQALEHFHACSGSSGSCVKTRASPWHGDDWRSIRRIIYARPRAG
jgi:hypothetical protein